MIKGYIEFTGKHPKAKKENREYQDKPNPSWRSYGAGMLDSYMKVDVDDCDHKTGELVEPIHGKPRSEAIIKWLDDNNYKYNAIQTECGVHLFFKVPSCLANSKNKINWYSPIGIKCEWKFGSSGEHIPFRINGIDRQFIRGAADNADVDELPKPLYPLQKSKDGHISLSFPSGDRTDALCRYLFQLVVNKGFTADEAFEIIRVMNDYTFEKPIPQDTLNAEILNESTYKKLCEAELTRNNKNISPNEVGESISNQYNLIAVNGVIYRYENGVYKEISENEIKSFVCNEYPTTKSSFRREVVEYIRDKQFKKIPVDDNLINVRNGLLKISDDGSVEFTAHTPEYISFKQFNAAYDPEVKSELLDNTIIQWFKGSKPQIELFKQVLGYLMMNDNRYNEVFFFIGAPQTGKSTVLQIIEYFCGKGNVSNVPPQNFSKEFALEPLINKIANIAYDLPKSKINNSSNFKLLSSGDPIQINRKNKPMINYAYHGKMLFGSNYKPHFNNDFDGIKRRCTIFTFDKVYEKGSAECNPSLKYDLMTDESMTALLNMAIEGYISLKANNGFNETKESIAAAEELERHNDNILMWISECEITEDILLRNYIKHEGKGHYPDYQGFCYNIGEEPAKYNEFRDKICEVFHLTTKQKWIPGTRTQGSKGKKTQFFVKI